MPAWDKLKQIFSEASDLDEGSRPEFLRQACGGDEALKAELERLLAKHDSGDSFFDRPTGEQGWLGDPELPPRVLEEGAILAGRFRIICYLGGGGMGEVYQAEDLELGGSVALKTLRARFTGDPTGLRRFKREIQIARKVTHPNICRIFDVGRHHAEGGDLVFLTMEFLPGHTLAEQIAIQGSLAAAEALPLIQQMAAGLDALHQAGVVHRDFKPGNIMVIPAVDAEPRAVITDFGLSRVVIANSGEYSVLSRSGNIWGTPDYMSPEQLSGKEVTPASDIYAFGLVLYEMLCGAKPFPGGAPVENAVQRVTQDPTPLHDRRPNTDERWESTILLCLSRQPTLRPSSAKQVAAILEGTAEPIPPPSAQITALDLPVPTTASAPKPLKRWLVPAAIIFLVLALAILAQRVGIWSTNSAIVAAEPQNVAVLPFRVIGDDETLTAFGDGLMETITSRLSQFEGMNQELLVVPASEVRRQEVTSAGAARAKFGVNYVVEGSLQAQGERVRLMLTLVDTERLRQLETAIVEDDRAKALNLQDGAVARVANLLNIQVEPKFIAEYNQAVDSAPGVYEFYLQGKGYLQRNDKVENIDHAITLFRRALDIDAQYAPAYAGLGEAYWYKYERTSEPHWVDDAQANCEKALLLNRHLPDAHVTLGRVLNGTGRSDEAVKSFQTALELAPRNGSAFEGLGKAYSTLKELDKAETTYQKAVELRPGDWMTYKQLGLYYYGRGDYKRAAIQFQRVVQLTPDSAQGYANLGSAYYFSNRLQDARLTWEKSLEIEPRSTAYSNLGALLITQGHYKEAAEYLGKAVELDPNDFRTWGNLGSAYFWNGDDRAAAAFSRALRLTQQALAINEKRDELYSYLAHYSLAAGKIAEARTWQQKADARQTSHVSELIRNAATHERLGNRGAAIRALERALDAGGSRDEIESRPSFEGLIQDPSYQTLRNSPRDHTANRAQ